MKKPTLTDPPDLSREIMALNRRVGRLEGKVSIIILLIGGTLAGVVALVVKSL